MNDSNVIFWVTDSSGARYTQDWPHSGEALIEAVRKYAPATNMTSKAAIHGVWHAMQSAGYTMTDRPAP